MCSARCAELFQIKSEVLKSFRLDAHTIGTQEEEEEDDSEKLWGKIHPCLRPEWRKTTAMVDEGTDETIKCKCNPFL